MNEKAKGLTVEFLMNQLAIEDCNTQHKILSQLNSISSMNFAAYDQSAPVERTWDRIILEHRLLQITLYHLENPQEWKGSV